MEIEGIYGNTKRVVFSMSFEEAQMLHWALSDHAAALREGSDFGEARHNEENERLVQMASDMHNTIDEVRTLLDFPRPAASEYGNQGSNETSNTRP